jgi:hypothetical protein
MLNEFVYSRLFYLEWVQGEWRDSADTEEAVSSIAGSTWRPVGWVLRRAHSRSMRDRCSSPSSAST